MIRDVAGSYRRALQETVYHYSGLRPSPQEIDALKAEGNWNNDWDASMELLRRIGADVPTREALISIFSGFYFGGDPDGASGAWSGYIRDEPLLVDPAFFTDLTAKGHRWGFVSGAEPPSARYVLEQRLGLDHPALIAMGDAPDKPNPSGLIRLADQLAGNDQPEQVAYLGDTVADVRTVLNARQQRPDRTWHSLAVAPPHVMADLNARSDYEATLRNAGADRILSGTSALLDFT